MKFVNTAILTILSGVVMGIITSDFFRVDLQNALMMCLFVITTLSVHLFLSVRKIKYRKFFVFHTFVVSFVVGLLSAALHDSVLKSTHYINLLKENEHYLLQTKVIGKVSESDFGTTYKAQ